MSQVFLIANAVFCRIAVINGAGEHIETLTIEQAKTASMWIIASFLPGIVAFSLPKIVIAKLLLDVIDGADKKKLWWTVIATVVVSLLVLAINAVLLVLTLVAAKLDPGKEVVSKDALVAFACISGGIIHIALQSFNCVRMLNCQLLLHSPTSCSPSSRSPYCGSSKSRNRQNTASCSSWVSVSCTSDFWHDSTHLRILPTDRFYRHSSGIAAIIKTVFLRSFFDPDFTCTCLQIPSLSLSCTHASCSSSAGC